MRDLCELYQNLRPYDRRIVAVRGIVDVLYGDPYPEGYYFQEIFRRDCRGKANQRFSARLRLLSPEKEDLEHPPPGYRFDEESLRKIEKLFDAHRKENRRVRALVTVEGFLRVKKGMVRQSEKERGGKGLQAEIVVQAIRDPVFLDK